MRSIGTRIAGAMALVALAAGVLTLMASLWSVRSRFEGYLTEQSNLRVSEAAQYLGSYYAARGSWSEVQALLVVNTSDMNHMTDRSHMGGKDGMMALAGLGASRLRVADAAGRVVADTAGHADGQLLPEEWASGIAIQAGGRRVGTLVIERPAVPPLSALDRYFMAQAAVTAGLAGLGAAAAAGLLGLWLSRQLIRPLQGLTAAARQLAQRDLGTRVPVHGRDELAVLAGEFNRMAAQLERQEQLRRNMVADVAHELRTPVTILRTRLEAIQDGVTDPAPEELLPLHDEVLRLARLLDDLQALSLAEAGQLPLHLSAHRPAELAEAAAAVFRPAAAAKGIAFECRVAAGLGPVRADGDRIQQVLLNLLGNALRHTPAGGSVELTVDASQPGARFSVVDTGEGINPEDLPHIFNRFYRADKSRSRAGGGSGLGLAIARGIVAAHGSEISVQSTLGQGSRFWFDLIEQ